MDQTAKAAERPNQNFWGCNQSIDAKGSGVLERNHRIPGVMLPSMLGQPPMKSQVATMLICNIVQPTLPSQGLGGG